MSLIPVVLQPETGLLHEPKMRDEYWQSDNLQGKTELVSRKPTTLLTADFTWTAVGLSPCLCGDKPIVNHPSKIKTASVTPSPETVKSLFSI